MKLLAFVVQVAVVSAATVIFSVSTSAITVQEVPGLRPNSWVNDSINILSPKTETEINRVIDQLEAKNRSEIMVITVPETTGYSSPREFALAWFNHWTIGKKGLDNGVLLMYSRGDDRAGQTPRDRIEIVTGWGLTELFPDQDVVSLIQRDIRPRVNKREYDGAMLTGTQKIAAVLQKYQPKPKSPVSSEALSTPKKSFQEKATTPFSFQPLNFFLAILYGILYVLIHIIGFVLVLVLLVLFSLLLASPFIFLIWLVRRFIWLVVRFVDKGYSVGYLLLLFSPFILLASPFIFLIWLGDRGGSGNDSGGSTGGGGGGGSSGGGGGGSGGGGGGG